MEVHIKKMLKAIWLFALGVSLLALVANVSMQQWAWSGVMLLLTAYNLFMLYLSGKLLTENDTP